MSHSYTNLLYHIVYSTKHRHPWLDNEVRQAMFDQLRVLIEELNGFPLAVNGMPDHVHLLVRLHQDHTIAGMLRELKAKSSLWLHKHSSRHKGFAWQTGYGAFSVSRSQVEMVRRYIQNQEAHHRRRDFQTEFVTLLRLHTCEFEEATMWD